MKNELKYNGLFCGKLCFGLLMVDKNIVGCHIYMQILEKANSKDYYRCELCKLKTMGVI